MPGVALGPGTDGREGAREPGGGARGFLFFARGSGRPGLPRFLGPASRRFPWLWPSAPLQQPQPGLSRLATVPEAATPRAPRLSRAGAAPKVRMPDALDQVKARVIRIFPFIRRRLGRGPAGIALNEATRGARGPEETRMPPSLKGSRRSSREANALLPPLSLLSPSRAPKLAPACRCVKGHTHTTVHIPRPPSPKFACAKPSHVSHPRRHARWLTAAHPFAHSRAPASPGPYKR